MRHPVLPIIGGSGLLGSAALLYVVYRPFSIALEQFIRSGNAESLGLLRSFYAILTPPFGLYRAEQDSLKTSKRAKLPAW